MQANGGTLFLDEIAEIPMNLQSKLLRVLEDWNIRKVGENGLGRRVDVNLVLATNKNLEEAVSAQSHDLLVVVGQSFEKFFAALVNYFFIFFGN